MAVVRQATNGNSRQDILTHSVEIAIDDGTSMRAYVARPAAPGTRLATRDAWRRIEELLVSRAATTFSSQ